MTFGAAERNGFILCSVVLVLVFFTSLRVAYFALLISLEMSGNLSGEESGPRTFCYILVQYQSAFLWDAILISK